MSEQVEGIRGEFRRLTPTEIALIVRMTREGRGIKRASLALEAKVSEKTIERIEKGEGVRGHSYDRVANALGLKAGAFTAEMYVPTLQEIEDQTNRREEEVRKTHRQIAVTAINDVREISGLLSVHAVVYDEQRVNERDLELIAALKENVSDWSWIVGEIGDVERLNAARQILDQVREIEVHGYVAKTGICNSYVLAGTRVAVGVVTFFPKPRWPNETLPDTIWLPRRVSSAF